MRASTHDRVKRGHTDVDELAFLPKSWVREAELVFPKDAFAEYDRD